MIPDKDGYWWFRNEINGDPKIAKVRLHSQGIECRVPGYMVFNIPAGIRRVPKNIEWLGPVNPEPMKASGE